MRSVLAVLALGCLSLAAQGSLIANGDFNHWTSGNPDSWNLWYGNWWQDATDDVCVLGWVNGAVMGQGTGHVVAADTQYTFSAVVQTRAEGGGQVEGATLIIQDVSNGYADIIRQDFMFADYGDLFGTTGPWREFSVSFDSGVRTDLVGHELLVAIAVKQPGSWHQYGNLYVDSVTLVPEPASIVLIGLGALVTFKKRKTQN